MSSSVIRRRERSDLVKFSIFLLIAAVFTYWVAVVTAAARPGDRVEFKAVFADVSVLKFDFSFRIDTFHYLPRPAAFLVTFCGRFLEARPAFTNSLPTFLGMPMVLLPAAAAYIAPCWALDLIGITYIPFRQIGRAHV